MARRINEDLRRNILDLRKRGMAMKEIAGKTGKSVQTVFTYLRREKEKEEDEIHRGFQKKTGRNKKQSIEQFLDDIIGENKEQIKVLTANNIFIENLKKKLLFHNA